MKSLVIHWLRTTPEFLTLPAPEWLNQKLRIKCWLRQINEDPSVLYWWMLKFQNILNLRYIYCQLDAPNDAEKGLKIKMRRFIKGKFVLVCDQVYRGIIDHNPLDLKVGGCFNEFGSMVCIHTLSIAYTN